MPRRLLSVLAMWTLVAGWLAYSETPVASQNRTHVPAPLPDRVLLTTPHMPPDQQMWALEHHARTNMILYTGRFGQSDWATAKVQLNAIPLTVQGR